MTSKLRKTDAPASSGATILVVDDFADNREMYRDYLEYQGHRVLTAENGQQAIDVARAERPDLIVMDLSLPIVDGWEATRILKKESATKDIVVVALSGHALQGNEEDARSAGCDAFIAKPCLPEDLAQKIAKMLPRRVRKA